jgi:hypothetical protein
MNYGQNFNLPSFSNLYYLNTTNISEKIVSIDHNIDL